MKTRLLKRLRREAAKCYILWLARDGSWIVSQNGSGRAIIKTNSYNYAVRVHHNEMNLWIRYKVFGIRGRLNKWRR